MDPIEEDVSTQLGALSDGASGFEAIAKQGPWPVAPTRAKDIAVGMVGTVGDGTASPQHGVTLDEAAAVKRSQQERHG